MALQGTLDTFALSDVLFLLAGTQKTGDLAVEGDRSTGHLAFAGGGLVGGSAGTATGTVDTLFALLRNRSGAFEFSAADSDEVGEGGPVSAREAGDPVEAGDPIEVGDALAVAQGRLAEWETIEAVVPSLTARVALAEELSDKEVVIDRTTWRLLLAVGSGSTVGEIGTALVLDEWNVSAAVRDLVTGGLAVVTPAPEPGSAFDVDHSELSTGPEAAGSLMVDLDSTLEAPVTSHAYLSTQSDDDGLPEPLPVSDDVDTPADGLGDGLVLDTEASLEPEPPAEVDEQHEDEADEAGDEGPEWVAEDEAEVERQLGTLSPAAARAVADAADNEGSGATESGRRALRRIISNGR